jgi:hypothetical protein
MDALVVISAAELLGISVPVRHRGYVTLPDSDRIGLD